MFGQTCSVKKISTLPLSLTETSALVWYKNQYLLSINDSGNTPEIFVLDEKGKLIKKIKITNCANIDWEDLAVDDEDNLYIGDFGNNENRRKSLKILIVKDGFIDKDEVTASTIEFSYEDQKKFPPAFPDWNYDMEAFFWKNDTLYLFSKNRTEPYNGYTYVYTLPAKPGKYKAQKIGGFLICDDGWKWCSVTGADYYPETNQAVLITYSSLYIFEFPNYGFTSVPTLTKYGLPIIKQREGICFKSANELYMTDEVHRVMGGGNLYSIKLKK